MSRLFCVVLALVAILALPALAHGQTPQNQPSRSEPTRPFTVPSADGEWTTVTSEAGFYQVDFPGIPYDTVRAVKTEGSPVDSHQKVYEGSDVVFITSYSDLGKAAMDSVGAEAVLDGAVGRLVERVEREEDLQRKAVQLEGYPGTHVIGRTPQFVMDMHVYVVGGRLYQAGVIYKDEKPDGVERFIDSFALTVPADSIAASDWAPTLIERRLGEIGWAYDQLGENYYRVTLEVDSARTHAVFLEEVEARLGTGSQVNVWGVVYNGDLTSLSADRLVDLLRESGRVDLGAYQAYDQDTGTQIVLSIPVLGVDAEADVLREVMSYVARSADASEQAMMNGDEW